MVGVAEANPSVGIVTSYAIWGREVRHDGYVPYPHERVDGRDICRATLEGRCYVFGSPSSLLLRADEVRKRPAFYNEPNFHADTEACFDVLRTTDLGFVHQILTRTRVHEDAMTSVASKLDTFQSGWLTILHKYGRYYLDRGTYRRRWLRAVRRYVVFLAKARPTGCQAWVGSGAGGSRHGRADTRRVTRVESAPIGIVPAAGHARRLQPLACSKEVCRVGERPVLDYLLERMKAAGCEEVRVVTRPEKRDVVDLARARGASIVFGRPATVSESLLAGLDRLRPETPVVFGFPDTLWEPLDGFARLLAALERPADVALGIFRAEAPARSDVVTLEEDRVTSIHVKPEHPVSDLIWGCAASRAGVLRGMRGRPEPGDYFDELARRGLVRAIRLGDSFVDIGTPQSLRRARANAGAASLDNGPGLSGEDAA
jgi:hypothetical protein